MGFGGPHAGYMAVRDGLERQLPGRLVGVSRGRRRHTGLPAGPADPRAAHPPREGHQQHLHRPGAARRHGRRCTPSTTARDGLRRDRRTGRTAAPRCSPPALRDAGVDVVHDAFFDTADRCECRAGPTAVVRGRARPGIHLHLVDADTCRRLRATRRPRADASLRARARRRRSACAATRGRHRRAGRRRRAAGRAAPRRRRTSRTRCSHTHHSRDGDDALPAHLADRTTRSTAA